MNDEATIDDSCLCVQEGKKKMEVLKRIINIRGGYGHGGRKQVMLPKRAYSQYVEM